MKLKTTFKLSQNLRMSQQLQQAIKLLQLSRQELSTQIKKELLENPILEETVESKENEKDHLSHSDSENYSEKSEHSDNSQDQNHIDLDWENYYNLSSHKSTDGIKHRSLASNNDISKYESFLAQPRSLDEHLVWQLNLCVFNEKENKIGHFIIDSIGEDGYLKTSCEELSKNSKYSLGKIKKVLQIIQTFDPVGVGARSLKECLSLQAQLLGETKEDLTILIQNHLKHLEQKDYKKIAQVMNRSEERITELCNIIYSMDPKPGLAYYDQSPNYVTPDVYVRKVGDSYVVILNEEDLPRLCISNHYKNILQSNGLKCTSENSEVKKTKKYIENKLNSALWLIRAVNQRNKTIYRVMESLVKRQRDFFEKGPQHIKPLILRTVAEDLEVHESTISRITSNKYVSTSYGTFSLKYFFSSGIVRKDGSSLSTQTVKLKIKELVKKEKPSKPLSDQKLSEALKKEVGINLARRTVAKYRESMDILPASKRKKIV